MTTPPIDSRYIAALWDSQLPIEGGEGCSRNRQQRFRDAHEALEPAAR